MVSFERRGCPGCIDEWWRADTAAADEGLAALLIAVVETADVVGQGVWLRVRGVVAAGFWVHVPLHEVRVVAFGEAAEAGEVAGEAGDAERDGGRPDVSCLVCVFVVEADRGA